MVFFALHQSALSLFRFVAALGRSQVVANTFATFTILIVFLLGGFIVAKGLFSLTSWGLETSLFCYREMWPSWLSRRSSNGGVSGSNPPACFLGRARCTGLA